MPCFAPLTAFYGTEKGKSGKRAIVFKHSLSFSGVPLKLPCGQCIGCRLEKSRQWAMRCMHEKQMHEESCFVTLTYDDENLPKGGSLLKRDMQLFMKRLRKAYSDKQIRFYGCGEYGETTRRPHYHLLLFGLQFADRQLYKRGKSGEHLYTSEILRQIWPYGHNVIGDVTFDSAAYVARYVMKKVTGEAAAAHYISVDEMTGELYGLAPEFTNMSRRPGIGLEWFQMFGNHAYKFDSVIMNGLEVRPPRYYDGKYELVDSKALDKLKRKRRRKAVLSKSENTPERREVREIVAIKNGRMFRRDLQ